MKRLSDRERIFLKLVKAGLWELDVRLADYGNINYNEVFQLTEEQSVYGIVAAGLEHISDMKVPQQWALQFAGQTILLEKRNKEMNDFIAKLIELLRKNNIYTLLVKGQGIAQCYERPLWRACGDVDLLLSESNYIEAKKLLTPLANTVNVENKKRKHIGFYFDSWLVELHGTLYTRQLIRLNKVIDEVQHDVFYFGNVRSWMNGHTTVFLPSPDNDVFFVFAHIIQHYFGGGVGLRQICDWCRLLWSFKDSINISLLENRLQRAGMTTEWKTFAALAVEYLGMPVEAMPLYSADNRWRKKARKVLVFVIKTGNLGHNIDAGYRKKYPFIVWKTISLWRYVRNTVTHLSIFPKDSIIVLMRMVFTGYNNSSNE